MEGLTPGANVQSNVRPAAPGRWIHFIRRHLTRTGVVAGSASWLVAAGFVGLIATLCIRADWTPGQLAWTTQWPLYEIVIVLMGVIVASLTAPDRVPFVVRLVGYGLLALPFVVAVAFTNGGAIWLAVFMASQGLGLVLHRLTEKDRVGRGMQLFVGLVTLGVAFLLYMDLDANALPKFAGGPLDAPLRIKLVLLAACGVIHFGVFGLLEMLLDPLWSLPDLADRRTDPDWWRRRYRRDPDTGRYLPEDRT